MSKNLELSQNLNDKQGVLIEISKSSISNVKITKTEIDPIFRVKRNLPIVVFRIFSRLRLILRYYTLNNLKEVKKFLIRTAAYVYKEEKKLNNELSIKNKPTTRPPTIVSINVTDEIFKINHLTFKMINLWQTMPLFIKEQGLMIRDILSRARQSDILNGKSRKWNRYQLEKNKIILKLEIVIKQQNDEIFKLKQILINIKNHANLEQTMFQKKQVMVEQLSKIQDNFLDNSSKMIFKLEAVDISYENKTDIVETIFNIVSEVQNWTLLQDINSISLMLQDNNENILSKTVNFIPDDIDSIVESGEVLNILASTTKNNSTEDYLQIKITNSVEIILDSFFNRFNNIFLNFLEKVSETKENLINYINFNPNITENMIKEIQNINQNHTIGCQNNLQKFENLLSDYRKEMVVFKLGVKDKNEDFVAQLNAFEDDIIDIINSIEEITSNHINIICSFNTNVENIFHFYENSKSKYLNSQLLINTLESCYENEVIPNIKTFQEKNDIFFGKKYFNNLTSTTKSFPVENSITVLPPLSLTSVSLIELNKEIKNIEENIKTARKIILYYILIVKDSIKTDKKLQLIEKITKVIKYIDIYHEDITNLFSQILSKAEHMFLTVEGVISPVAKSLCDELKQLKLNNTFLKLKTNLRRKVNFIEMNAWQFINKDKLTNSIKKYYNSLIKEYYAFTTKLDITFPLIFEQLNNFANLNLVNSRAVRHLVQDDQYRQQARIKNNEDQTNKPIILKVKPSGYYLPIEDNKSNTSATNGFNFINQKQLETAPSWFKVAGFLSIAAFGVTGVELLIKKLLPWTSSNNISSNSQLVSNLLDFQQSTVLIELDQVVQLSINMYQDDKQIGEKSNSFVEKSNNIIDVLSKENKEKNKFPILK